MGFLRLRLAILPSLSLKNIAFKQRLSHPIRVRVLKHGSKSHGYRPAHIAPHTGACVETYWCQRLLGLY